MSSVNLRAARLDDHIYPLSHRELEVLTFVAMGYSNSEIGERLFVSKRTIDYHLYMIYAKLNVVNRVQAIRTAQSLKIFTTDIFQAKALRNNCRLI